MNNRDSNIELLRLLCMFGIVLMHFIGLSVYPEVWNPKTSLSANVIAGTMICSVTILAVNIFGLISGYYGIRFSWKRLLILYVTCALYALLGCGIGYFSGEAIGLKTMLLETFLPFTHTSSGLWYIQCYVGLVLFVPLLNKTKESVDKKEYLMILLLFTIANVYFGRYWKVPTYNIYGYSVAQLVYLYLIGGYIKRFVPISKLSHTQIIIPILLSMAIWIGLTLMQHIMNVPHWSPTSYNHIVVLAASIAMFMLFIKHPFKSMAINFLAPGALAIYLFHQNSHVWKMLKEWLNSCECLNSTAGGMAILAIFALGLCFAVVLFDKIRQGIINIIFRR